MKLTVDIVKEIVEGLTLTTTVSSVVFSFPNSIITVSNVYHLRENMTVDLNGTDYTVISVDSENNAFTIAGDLSGSEGLTVTVPNPFYFHGTPIATNQQIFRLSDSSKVPMIYLYEELIERVQGEDSGILKESDLTLYFLDNADFEDWTTANFYTSRIYGLNKLVEAFIAQLRANTHFDTFDTVFTKRNKAKFGVFREMRGAISKVFDDDLTGVELSFTLNIKNLDCI